MIFIKTLMNADRIYTYLMKLKLNLRIGPNSNCEKTLYGYKINVFTLSKNLALAVSKSSPPPPGKQMIYLIKKIKCREHSSIPTLPGFFKKNHINVSNNALDRFYIMSSTEIAQSVPATRAEIEMVFQVFE